MKLHRKTISPETPVQWAMISTVVGGCLVARLKDGGAICALYLGDDTAKLMGALPYKNLSLIEDCQSLTLQLDRAFSGEPCDLDVVLDVTDFRFMVLDTLTRSVGFAQTVTYADLAMMCGREKAVRAVASALANNPVSMLVPCHRVVPKGGGVGQYLWGAPLKAEIQNFEKSLKR